MIGFTYPDGNVGCGDRDASAVAHRFQRHRDHHDTVKTGILAVEPDLLYQPFIGNDFDEPGVDDVFTIIRLAPSLPSSG